MNDCFISICIPAYKRVDFLKRLLDSISRQTYEDFEVIVTDDSASAEVQALCALYANQFTLLYFKNPTTLNTPENWNEAIRRASGKWVKLIHDDDWFSRPDSLQRFADAVAAQPDCNFFFCAYTNVYEGVNNRQRMTLKPFWKNALATEPNVLIADNVIGPPSVTLHRNDKTDWYDRSMKYIVDIDFYIRYLQRNTFCYIPESLVNVGINNAQVTKYTFGVAEVHLKEALVLLGKTGSRHLKNVIVFDGWWRLLRNFNIKTPEQLHATGFEGAVPDVILQIIRFQKKVPGLLLRIGVSSKGLMLLCYALLRCKKITF